MYLCSHYKGYLLIYNYIETDSMQDLSAPPAGVLPCWQNVQVSSRTTQADTIGSSLAAAPAVRIRKFGPTAIAETSATDLRIPTGIISLDQEIRGGASPGKFHLIAAYTGVGKSSFAVHLAATAARYGHPVLFFHSEMALERDYVPRLLSWETGEPYGQISARPQTNPSLPSWIREQVSFFNVHAGATRTLNSIRARIEDLQHNNSATPLVIVDTLDYLVDSGSTYDRRLDLETVCTNLAGIAVGLNVPIWATSQANDQAANTDIVTMQCLRDARGKAMPCSLFLGLGMSEENRARGILTINAEKNRDGEPFVLRVRADLGCQRFSDLHEDLE